MSDMNVRKMIQDNLAAFYGYAYDKLYEKDKAADLAHEIIIEILYSVENLKDDRAFWGYAWKIAENTFRKFIRREDIKRRAEFALEQDFDKTVSSPENIYINHVNEKDNTYLLRRELSLLAKTHRSICLAYYVDNKSCLQISKEQNISVEMVKYHLFKTRRLLKEGMGMTRELGKRSYNPGTFRLDFWGDRNQYFGLCERKLPGNILLATYNKPLSAEELSVELGVAMPYLEEEIEILEAAGMLRHIGKKYQTNIVIITDKSEKKVDSEIDSICSQALENIFEIAVKLLPEIKKLNFQGNSYDDNRMLFAVLNVALINSFDRAKDLSPYGDLPRLKLGGNGWVWGYDYDYTESHFNGVTMHTNNKSCTAWFSAENYKVIEPCQLYDHYRFSEKTEAICDAALGKEADRENESLPWLIENGFIFSKSGRLSANFPVFTNDVYSRLLDVLEPIIDPIANCMITVSDKAAKILQETAPADVRDQCEPISKIVYRLNVAAYVFEQLVADNRLRLPDKKTPLCMWASIN